MMQKSTIHIPVTFRQRLIFGERISYLSMPFLALATYSWIESYYALFLISIIVWLGLVFSMTLNYLVAKKITKTNRGFDVELVGFKYRYLHSEVRLILDNYKTRYGGISFRICLKKRNFFPKFLLGKIILYSETDYNQIQSKIKDFQEYFNAPVFDLTTY